VKRKGREKQCCLLSFGVISDIAMPKSLSLADLKRIAIAKHGENRAWSLAMLNGNPNHKKSWQEAIATPALSLAEQLDHEIWQEQVKADFKAKWNNGLKQQFEDRS